MNSASCVLRAIKVPHFMKKIGVLFLIGSLNAKTIEIERLEELKIGNFALPTSQQPGPLIGFGQNIIDKGNLQIFVYPDYLKGHKKKFTEVAPSIVYGFRDDLSIFIEQPFAIKFKKNNRVSHGAEDMLVQLEYAVYEKDTETAGNLITVVGNITLPIGSALKVPATGFGSHSFFLGFTASHTATDWYYFTSMGGIITTSDGNTKIGNQFLYQFGLSKNISYKSDKWLFNWMIELDGIYKARDKRVGLIEPNSGGNQILLGPSFWFSTQRFIMQGGISWFIYQHLLGVQNKDKYLIAFNFGWTF